MDTLRQDLRYALRVLGRSRGFTLIAVLCLGLGMGVTTAVFSIVNALHFRSLPFQRADELVDVAEHHAELCAGCGVGTSYPTYLDVRERTASFVETGAYTTLDFVLSGRGDAQRVTGTAVSHDLFPLLGVMPALGRGILAEEDRAGTAPVVLLSHELWRGSFQGDRSVLGGTVRLNGAEHTVVGVMPEGFGFPERSRLWTALGPVAHAAGREDRSIGMVARLAPGVTLAQARAQVDAVTTQLAQEWPATNGGWFGVVQHLRDDFAEDYRGTYPLLLASAVLVLLVVCANLAGLMLARGLVRRPEVVVRAALGAGRGRLVRQMLTEAGVIAVLGAAAGVLLSDWVLRTLLKLYEFTPYWLDVSVDYRVIAFAGALALGTTLLFGLMPALRTATPRLDQLLRDAGRSASVGRQGARLRSGFVVVQIALTAALLSVAVVTVRTVVRVQRIDDLGWDTRGVLVAQVDLLAERYAEASQADVYATALLDAARSIPGVTAAGASSFQMPGPMGGRTYTVEGAAPDAGERIDRGWGATPDYFRTAGIPLKAGRSFGVEDRVGALPVAIVNEEMARRIWPGESALGKRFRYGGADAADAEWMTVVGVVGNALYGPIVRRPLAYFYVPYAQRAARQFTLLVRTEGDPLPLAPLLRARAREIDPDQPLENVQTVESMYHDWTRGPRVIAAVMGSFGGFAVVLAALGLYGLVAYAVRQRAREIGIRRALGAGTRDVLELVARQAITLAAAGLVFGAAGAVALLRFASGVFSGLGGMDPLVLLLVAVLLALVAVLASVTPAYAAVRVEPLSVLRPD